MQRGEVWWADLLQVPPRGSEPGNRRPVLIVQADEFTKSDIRTLLVVVLTSNLRLGTAPGNVALSGKATGLPKTSVANVSQIVTLDKTFLLERVGKLSAPDVARVDAGLLLALGLADRTR
jgi:mRNA interferase MazF